MLRFVLGVEHATPPARPSAGAAGYDLHCSLAARVPARGRALVRTDVSVRLPPGTYGRVAPRPGLGWKYGIDVGQSVIDGDYTGDIFVLLFNHSDQAFELKAGAKIARLVVQRFEALEPEVERAWLLTPEL